MPLVKCKAESLDLTANYTFTGDVSLSGGGALNLIFTQTASSSSSISFTTGIDSTYDEYWFIFNNMHPATNSAYFHFQGSTNGGSSYNTTITSTYFSAYHSESDAAAGITYVTADDKAQGTDYQTLADQVKNDNDTSVSGILKLYNPSSTTYVKHFMSVFSNANSSDVSTRLTTAGYFNTTSPINAIDFKYSSGNTDDGTIQMFGVSK